MTTAPEAISRAFGAHLRSGAELLTLWKSGLEAEEATKLADFEAKGLRLGLSVAMPIDRYVIHVFLLDSAGETIICSTIEQAGVLNTSIN